jgi:hypothetical protein
MAQAILLVGPSQALYLPDTIPVMFTGLGILGLAIGILMVPMLPEIIEPVQIRHGVPLSGEESQKSAQIADKASVLFNLSCCFGCVISPILGGAITEVVGYRPTADYVAAFGFIISAVYLLVGVCLHKEDENAKYDKLP